MKRIGIWVLLAALVISMLRIGTDRSSAHTFTEENWSGFVYRAPWNSSQQLTVLGKEYACVLWTQGYSDALVTQLEAGCYVRFDQITFKPGKENRNPGTFNYRMYLKSRKIDSVCSADAEDLQILEKTPMRFWIRVPGSVFRSYLQRKLSKYMTAESFGLLQGVMTGDTGGLSETDTQAFRTSGLSHLMAVSGTHVVYILYPFRSMFRRSRLSYKMRNLLLLLPLLLFWCIADYTPSVTRAVWMTAGVLVARILERPPDRINMLTLSGAVQMLCNPYVLLNNGFLMSYGAACAIYWIAPVLAKKMPKLKTLIVGLSVQVALTPLMLYQFGEVSLCGVFLTMLASLPAGVLCGGGYLFAIVSFVPGSTVICQWIAYLLHALSKFLLWLAHVGAKLPAPIGQMRMPGFPLWIVVLIYAVLFLLCVFPKWWKRICAGATALAMTMLLLACIGRPVLKMLVIDVGQGSATLVQADGYVGLVDTGDGSVDLEEVLYAQGVKKLDFLVLSHGHTDHTGGLASVLHTFVPKIIYMSENQEVGLLTARQMAADAGVPVCFVSNGTQVKLGRVTATFIVSETFFCMTGDSTENNASLNVHFACKYGSMLLCGDLEKEGERALQETFALFTDTDILLVPHHGSGNGCSEKLLSNILPEYAIISVGVKNAYGHPAQETLERLEDYGIRVYRTDTGGGISITVGPTTWFRKRGIEIWQTL